MGTVTIKPIKVEFDCPSTYGIAYIKWYHYPEDYNHYFLRLAKYEQDTGWREVCIKIKKSELGKIRDVIDETSEKGIIMTESNRVEFDNEGIAYIRWAHYPEVPNHYFLRLYNCKEASRREVCVKIKKSELVKIRDAIDKTLNIGV